MVKTKKYIAGALLVLGTIVLSISGAFSTPMPLGSSTDPGVSNARFRGFSTSTQQKFNRGDTRFGAFSTATQQKINNRSQIFPNYTSLNRYGAGTYSGRQLLDGSSNQTITGQKTFSTRPKGVFSRFTSANGTATATGTDTAEFVGAGDTKVTVDINQGHPRVTVFAPYTSQRLSFAAGPNVSLTADDTAKTVTVGVSSSPTFNDIITKGPWVDVRAYMDGQAGRPTVAQWQAAQATTDLTGVVSAARAVSGNVHFSAGTFAGNFVFKTFDNVEGAGVGVTKLVPYNTTDPVVSVVQNPASYPYIKGMGFRIANLIVDGGQNHTAADPSATTNSYTGQHGIWLFGGAATGEPNSSIQQIQIDHVIVTACSGHGIYLDGTGGGTASIYAQVAWVKINNSIVTWNRGNGVRVEGVVNQTQITGASLIERNARGCGKIASETAGRNERAQVYYASTPGVGYPAVHSIDGGTTIQAGTDVWAPLAGSMEAGVSVHTTQSVNINNCYFETNDIGVYISGSIPGCSGVALRDNRILSTSTYGVLAVGGIGHLLDHNRFFQQGSLTGAGTGIKLGPSVATDISTVTLRDNTYLNLAVNRDLSAVTGSAHIVLQDQGEDAGLARSYLDAGAITVDLSTGAGVHYVAITGDTALTLTNPVVGKRYLIEVEQTTGAGRVTWTNGITWRANSYAPPFSTSNYRGGLVELVYRVNGQFYEVSRSIDYNYKYVNLSPTAAPLVNTADSAYITNTQIAYTSGGTYQVAVGDTITGATSGVTAKVTGVTITSGSWAGGDAAGTLNLSGQSGNFSAENLNVGANSNVATCTANSAFNYITDFTEVGSTPGQEIIVVLGDTRTGIIASGQMKVQRYLIGKGSTIKLRRDDTNSFWQELWRGEYAPTGNFMTTGTAVTSGSAITPTGTVFHVTGTAAVATINLPLSLFTGTIHIIPDGAFTLVTSGNIGKASTAVVNQMMTLVFDGTKWYPSY